MATKICFDFICDESLIFSSVASRFHREKISVCGITLGNRWPEAWQNKFDVTALDLDDEKIDWDSELARIAQQYKKYIPARFTQADRFVNQLDRNLQIKILVKTFLRIEEIVNSGVTVFITTGVAYLYNLVILAVAGYSGIKAMSLYGARQPEPRFTYSLGKGGEWERVNQSYELLKKEKNLNLSEEMSYIESFRQKAIAPDYMQSARQFGGIQSVFVKEFLLRLKRWYLEGWSVDSDYLTQHPAWYAWRDIKRVFYKKYLNLMAGFDPVESSEKYYIYPLHLQPEASTLVLGDDYVDQLNTIKSISKRLPLDTFLYVKEHPAAYGRHTLSFYKEIQKIYNVKLIDFQENTRKLILDSKGVIVISGTMGWEALMLGIPTIILGSVFYDHFLGAYKIESLNELEKLIQLDELERPQIKRVAIALKAIHEGTFPGYFDVHKLDTVKQVLSENNIDNIYKGVNKILTTERLN